MYAQRQCQVINPSRKLSRDVLLRFSVPLWYAELQAASSDLGSLTERVDEGISRDYGEVNRATFAYMLRVGI